MKVMCRLRGHDWLFPMGKMSFYDKEEPSISEKDYRCKRCGLTRDKDPKSIRETKELAKSLKKIYMKEGLCGYKKEEADLVDESE
jgi:hypothetical protein